ncbi:MAG: stage V sporulation protein AE [Clostridia bacterium]|nr:stage V sporulation protein AE [Clostridia bacterium]
MLEYVRVFLVGGLICVLAQILIDKTAMTGARILVSYVVLGVILSGIGVYQRVVDFGGAGATVPIVGFGHALAEGTKKAVDETGLLGALTGGLTGTAAGITAAVVFAFLWSLMFKSRQK